MTNALVGGAITDKNGFFEGYGITAHNELTAGTGMAFRVYRNGVATDCLFMITSGDNDGSGCKRARNFNPNPSGRVPTEDQQVHFFKAGERIAIRAEAPLQPDIVETTDITKINVFLNVVYDIITSETLSSQRFGGGNPGGKSVPGGGDDEIGIGIFPGDLPPIVVW